MRPLAYLCAVLLTASCAKHKEPESLVAIVASLDFGITPRLPAPDGGTYMSGVIRPVDGIIAQMVQDKTYEGGLAGAAAALALDISAGEANLTKWELREALWRAGYPYPVADAHAWPAQQGSPPNRDLIAWLDDVQPTTPMALVRARGRSGDVWVGIRGFADHVELGRLPRQAQLGQSLSLPPIEGGRYQLADPTGGLFEGTLDDGQQLFLPRSGEWVLRIELDENILAEMPIYVAIPPPTQPLLRMEGGAPYIAEADDATEHAINLMRHLRITYGMPAFEPDPLLGTALKRFQQDPSLGAAQALSTVGLADRHAVLWNCTDVTVENCIDRWLWDPSRRRILMSPDLDAIAMRSTMDPMGLHLTLMLVDAE